MYGFLNNMRQYPREIGIGLFLLFTLISILAGNILAGIHNCFNIYDLGIYHQAIVELGIDNLNPYLTVRGIKIFNDHFDPILLLAVFFVRLFGNTLEATILFEFLLFLVFIFLLVISVLKQNIEVKNQQKIRIVLLIIGMIVFSRGILTGILYPIHPTFWSIIPLFFICKYVKQQNLKGLFFSSLALCLFKEIFAPALIFFSFYYALIRNWKYFFSLLLTGVSGCIFAFYLRPLWMGDIFPHADRTLHVLSEGSLLTSFVTFFYRGEYLSALKLLYPFFIPFYLLYKNEIKKEGFKHFSIPLFFLIVPLFGIHFISGELWFQYGPIILGPLLAIIALSSIPMLIINNKKILIFTCLLFFISGLSKNRMQSGIAIRVLEDLIGTNYVEQLAGPYKYCSLTTRHRQAIGEVQKALHQIPLDKKILATGRIIPRIISPGRLIYSLGGHSKIQPSYDILLFEENNSNSSMYPMSKEEIKKVKLSCGKFSNKIYIDNSFYYLAKGKFPFTCLK